jgi:hypothetical protein
MEPIVLTDPTITPDEELVFARIGLKCILWKNVQEYIYSHHKEITEEWRFYNDGKCWLFRYIKKKKTICWIAVIATTFRVGFWVSDKAEPFIEQSDLPESVKDDFRNAKRTKIGRGFNIVMNNQSDVENAIKMIEIKLKIK